MTNIINKYRNLNPNPALDGIVYAKEYFPIPTTDDYTKQTIERFFVKPVNKEKIIEVGQESYRACSDFLYIKTNIYWKIAGSKNSIIINNKKQVVGVEEFNSKEIIRGNKVINGLNEKLTNPLEFYKA